MTQLVSSVRVEPVGAHESVVVYVKAQCVGNLVVGAGDGAPLRNLLLMEDEREWAAMREDRDQFQRLSEQRGALIDRVREALADWLATDGDKAEAFDDIRAIFRDTPGPSVGELTDGPQPQPSPAPAYMSEHEAEPAEPDSDDACGCEASDALRDRVAVLEGQVRCERALYGLLQQRVRRQAEALERVRALASSQAVSIPCSNAIIEAFDPKAPCEHAGELAIDRATGEEWCSDCAEPGAVAVSPAGHQWVPARDLAAANARADAAEQATEGSVQRSVRKRLECERDQLKARVAEQANLIDMAEAVHNEAKGSIERLQARLKIAEEGREGFVRANETMCREVAERGPRIAELEGTPDEGQSDLSAAHDRIEHETARADTAEARLADATALLDRASIDMRQPIAYAITLQLLKDIQAFKRGQPAEPFCMVPPIGWVCSRKPGHTGPCAASEAVQWSGSLTSEEQALIDDSVNSIKSQPAAAHCPFGREPCNSCTCWQNRQPAAAPVDNVIRVAEDGLPIFPDVGQCTHVAELEADLEAARAGSEVLRADLANSETDLAAANARIVELEAEKADAVKAYRQACKELNDTESEVAVAHERIAELELGDPCGKCCRLRDAAEARADAAEKRIAEAVDLCERGALASQIIEALRDGEPGI